MTDPLTLIRDDSAVFRPELGTPLPDRLVGDDHAADQHQLLDLAEAQRESVVLPDAIADDLGRKPEPFIRRACSGHDRRSCPTSPSRLTNLTVPPVALLYRCIEWAERVALRI